MTSKTSQAGFTLIELLVVMVILGLLAALVVPNYVRQGEKSKLQTTRAQIELLGTALDMFRLDVGRYPSSQEGLDALRQRPSSVDRWDGPYLKKDIPRDSWGNAFVYRSPGEAAPYDLMSYGADGVAGGSGAVSLREVSLVHVTKRLLRVSLRHARTVPLPESGHERLEAYERALSQFLQDIEVSPDHVVLCLSRRTACVSRLMVPETARGSLNQVIDYEVERLLPFPREDIYYDYLVHEVTGG
jgi:general secretion pathway protein G